LSNSLIDHLSFLIQNGAYSKASQQPSIGVYDPSHLAKNAIALVRGEQAFVANITSNEVTGAV
jgi:hypothetical protein